MTAARLPRAQDASGHAAQRASIVRPRPVSRLSSVATILVALIENQFQLRANYTSAARGTQA
jgi:hypothetical protein